MRAIAGEPLRIPADIWNRMQAAMLAYEAGAGQQRGGSRGSNWVLVHNGSGADVARFGVLGVSDVLVDEAENLTEFKNHFCFEGAAAAASGFSGRFAIAQEPIASGRVGWCVIHGPTVCKVNIGHADHQYADAKASATELLSGQVGSARIIYQESGTGTKWCVVSLGQVAAGTRLAKGTVTARSGTTPGSGTCTIQTITAGAIAATTDTVTAYSMSQTATAANAYVHIAWCNLTGKWWLVAEDCA